MFVVALVSVLVCRTHIIAFSGVSVLCIGSKMESVGIFVFILGLLCYVRSGKLYESSACNEKMRTVFAF